MSDETQINGSRGRLRSYLLAGAIVVLGLGAIGAARAKGMGFCGHGFGGLFGGGGFERVLGSVDASEEQRAQIREVAKAAQADIRPLTSDFDQRRDQIAALLAAETLDRAAFDTLRGEILETADAVSARGMEAFLDAAEVLTPGQRVELLEKRRHGRGGFGWGRD